MNQIVTELRQKGYNSAKIQKELNERNLPVEELRNFGINPNKIPNMEENPLAIFRDSDLVAIYEEMKCAECEEYLM